MDTEALQYKRCAHIGKTAQGTGWGKVPLRKILVKLIPV
jgi:hypothetical protein